MTTDLVRWTHPDQDGDETNDSEWDLPPTNPYPKTPHTPGSEHAARQAERDSAKANRRGDSSFAAVREVDAGEQRQRRWDWGDGRTWAWIAGICVAFLLFCLFVYVLPQNRHNQNDLPAPTPPIRVY